jgi:hypothetical protein
MLLDTKVQSISQSRAERLADGPICNFKLKPGGIIGKQREQKKNKYRSSVIRLTRNVSYDQPLCQMSKNLKLGLFDF